MFNANDMQRALNWARWRNIVLGEVFANPRDDSGIIRAMCSACGDHVGVLDRGELQHLMLRREGVICFACETVACPACCKKLPDCACEVPALVLYSISQQLPRIEGEQGSEGQ